DNLRFSTVARVSDINLGLYRMLVAPTVRAVVSEPMADALRAMHPNRLRFVMFSDQNPMMQPVEALANTVRAKRKPADPGNPLLEMQQAASSWITSSLQMLNEFRDAMTETVFLNTYGSPVLQALVGLQAEPKAPHIERDLAREADTARLRAKLEGQFETG